MSRKYSSASVPWHPCSGLVAYNFHFTDILPGVGFRSVFGVSITIPHPRLRPFPQGDNEVFRKLLRLNVASSMLHRGIREEAAGEAGFDETKHV